MLALLGAAGCSDRTAVLLPLGETCKVQFRRDALGAGASAPISATTDDVNGAATSLTGELVEADAHWLVLRVMNKDLYIPRQAVLLVEHQRP